MSDSGQSSHSKFSHEEHCENKALQDFKVEVQSDKVGGLDVSPTDNYHHNEELNLHFNNVVNDGVELAITKVIEESVQHVLTGEYGEREQDYAENTIIDVLALTVEESVQDVIHKFSLSDPEQEDEPAATILPHQGTFESCLSQTIQSEYLNMDSKFGLSSNDIQSSVLSSSHHNYVTEIELFPGTDSNTENISCSSQHDAGETDNKLQSWREAGKALREALSRFVISQKPSVDVPPKIDSSCSSTGVLPVDKQHNGIHNSASFPSSLKDIASVTDEGSFMDRQSLPTDVLHSSSSNPAFKQVITDCSLPRSATEASLTRSMEQSFAWKNELDPMNQMWEDYQSSHPPDNTIQTDPSMNNLGDNCSKYCVSATCQTQLLSNVSSDTIFAIHGGGDAPPLSSSDPTLSELRDKMRKLVSTLPIMANQSQKVSPNGNSSEIDWRSHRSPKNARRRHHRSSKEDPIVGSDDEKESKCSKRIPPRLNKTVQKVNKSSQLKVKHNKSNPVGEKCHMKHGKTVASQQKKFNETTGMHLDPMLHFVSDSNSDTSTKHIEILHKIPLESVEDQAGETKSVIEHVESIERTTESESGHTDVDKQLGTSNMNRTESAANFADIDSCESEMEKRVLLPEHSGGNEQLLELHVCVPKVSRDIKKAVDSTDNVLVEEDDSMSLENESSEEEVASLILAEKYSQKINGLNEENISDDDDLELFDELPDLVLSSNSTTDDDIELALSHKEIESLQDIFISDSSDAEAGVEGDDEFECDCNICQSPKHTREIDHTSSHELNHQEDDDQFGMQYLNDLSIEFRNYLSHSDDDSMNSAPVHLIPALSPLGLLSSDSYRRDFLDLMFTNVIMHMLSVYPDLLNEQTPPPVPEDLFQGFAVIKVSQSFIDDDVSCPICLCRFVFEEELKKLPCSHFFHPLCIQAWIQKAGTCPVCRHNLTQGPGDANS